MVDSRRDFQQESICRVADNKRNWSPLLVQANLGTGTRKAPLVAMQTDAESEAECGLQPAKKTVVLKSCN